MIIQLAVYSTLRLLFFNDVRRRTEGSLPSYLILTAILLGRGRDEFSIKLQNPMKINIRWVTSITGFVMN